ncbi:MAG: thioredoxin-dependent thiol peroxidase [Bacteroidetes bacterium]|nr:thioredoxin-dependent thiol peroxidase [Bacteroidota bacterium]
MTILHKFLIKAAKHVAFEKHHTKLKAGDKAPAIHGILHDGTEFDAKNYKGKKIVLYFYPKDSTPACTAQACSLRDNYKAMLKAGYAVLGVSADTVKKHQSFINKYDLPFPLISDPELSLIKAYDVWGKKQFMGRIFDGINRTTFVINEKGKIEEVISEVDTAGHAAQILG